MVLAVRAGPQSKAGMYHMLRKQRKMRVMDRNQHTRGRMKQNVHHD